MNKIRSGAALLVAVLCCAAPAVDLGRAGELPGGFVRLSSVDGSIHQDIRYATANNFVGRRIPGYEGAECWLRREVAEALSRVQADLARSGLGLVAYDCYRPRRAVSYFVRWAHDPSDQARKAAHYPAIDKSQLFARGYVATASGHSKGIAVDVGLVRRAGFGSGYEAVDLGTPFDFFGPSSRTADPSVSGEAKRNRAILVAAMTRHGFRNYRREWWHFTFAGLAGAPSFDFPIQP